MKKMLTIEQIDVTGKAQSRASIDACTVDEYADDIRRGAKFPAPVVFHDGERFICAAGHHTIAAMTKAGKKKIRCDVRRGDLRAARLYSVGDNATHGKRRTNEDKRRAVELVLEDEDWRKLSDREIARMCRVTHPLVGEVRRNVGSGNGYHPSAIAMKLPAATGISEPLKWHGGKQPLARRIVALMPAHTTYVEPFAGGLAVLLAKSPEGVSEIVNDIDSLLMNFWNVLREEKPFARFRRMAEATPFCEATWRTCEADLKSDGSVRRAWGFFVRCRQSLAGRMKSFAPLSVNRTRRGMNEQAAAWLSAVEGLPEVHERLKRVSMLNRDASEVIRQHDSPNTLFYCDPPYVPESRAAREVYAHEMTLNQHVQLLELLKLIRGKVILSGYPKPLYDETLAGWQRIDIDRANSAAGGDSKRRMTEVLWLNFPAAAIARAA